MAALSNKVTLFFRSNSGYGWTETYYYIGSGGVAESVTAVLASRRKAILSDDCALDHARISTAFARDPVYFNLNLQGGFNGEWPGPSNADFVALLINLHSNAGGFGRVFLRGVPDAFINANEFQPDTNYLTKLTQWENFLENPNIWGVQSTLSAGAKPKYAINTLTPILPRGYTFLSQELVANEGDVIRVHGASVPGFNGEKTIIKKEDITTTFKWTVGGGSPPVANPVTDTVYVTKLIYNYVGIVLARQARVTRRNTGRPFGMRRGRQSPVIPLRR